MPHLDADVVRAEHRDGVLVRVVVACENSPDSTTVSGDAAAIDELREILEAASIFNRRLKVDTAYHSHHMQRIANEYCDSLTGIATGQVREGVVLYSSVTGFAKSSGFGPRYWAENLVSKVRFKDAFISLTRRAAFPLTITTIFKTFRFTIKFTYLTPRPYYTMGISPSHPW